MEAVAFDPLLPLPLIAVLATIALLGVVAALWRGLTGWWLRGLAALVLLAALAGPSLRREDRTPVPNIAIVVVDDSASQPHRRPRTRSSQTALDGLEARLDQLGQTGGLEVRTVHVADRGEDGTQLLTALAEATAELPRRPHRRGDPGHRRPDPRPAGARDLPRPGAGAADRPRRRLGPAGRRRDRARPSPSSARRSASCSASRTSAPRRTEAASRRCRSRSTAPSRCASTCR